jgi:hypothetical protein
LHSVDGAWMPWRASQHPVGCRYPQRWCYWPTVAATLRCAVAMRGHSQGDSIEMSVRCWDGMLQCVWKPPTLRLPRFRRCLRRLSDVPSVLFQVHLPAFWPWCSIAAKGPLMAGRRCDSGCRHTLAPKKHAGAAARLCLAWHQSQSRPPR